MRIRPLLASIALSGLAVLGSATADASTIGVTPPPAQYLINYNISNLQTPLTDVVVWDQYGDGSAGNSSLYTINAGSSTFTDGFFQNKPLTGTFLVGLTTDLQHLVMFTNTSFAASAAGRDFSAVFSTPDEGTLISLLSQYYSSPDLSPLINFLASNAPSLEIGVGGTFQAVEFSNGQIVSDTGTVTVAAVPEPATWAMLVLGFAGVGYLSYRRTAKRALTAA